VVDRARVAAELPQPVAAWVRRRDEPQLWTLVARHVAVDVGAALLAGDPPGEGGILDAWGNEVFDLLARCPSPAVRALAPELPRGRRRWTAHLVAPAVCGWLGIDTGAQALRRMLVNVRPTRVAAPGHVIGSAA
jgi:hypothetical protein